MFIKKLRIKNFRLFPANTFFEIDNFNIPDWQAWSWINVFLWENACGKTTILDSLSLPLLSYKTDNISIQDFNNPEKDLNIEILSENNFDYDWSMPKSKFVWKWFSFTANIRKRDSQYLWNTIVSDQKFIRADWETKPDDNSPDIRISVNNPFKWVRFNENEILFLDKNRTYQTRSWTYATTKFDRLMERLNYQYIKNSNGDIEDLNWNFNETTDFLNNAIQKFNELCWFNLSLSVINNRTPYKKAFFNVKKENNQQILLESIWSWYETIFAIIYAFYMSSQTNKDLIIFIDEPELHLHPKLQEKLINLLFEIWKTAQIFLTSHSPLLVKQLLEIDNIYLKCIKNGNGNINVISPEDRVLTYLSSNEINFLAFWLATEEYYNELYNQLEIEFRNSESNNFKELKNAGNYEKSDSKQIIFDNEFFNKKLWVDIDSPFMKIDNKVTKYTFIRNKIHHSAENWWHPTQLELEEWIRFIRKYLLNNTQLKKWIN